MRDKIDAERYDQEVWKKRKGGVDLPADPAMPVEPAGRRTPPWGA
jgi:hypothetical protein